MKPPRWLAGSVPVRRTLRASRRVGTRATVRAVRRSTGAPPEFAGRPVIPLGPLRVACSRGDRRALPHRPARASVAPFESAFAMVVNRGRCRSLWGRSWSGVEAALREAVERPLHGQPPPEPEESPSEATSAPEPRLVASLHRRPHLLDPRLVPGRRHEPSPAALLDASPHPSPLRGRGSCQFCAVGARSTGSRAGSADDVPGRHRR